MKINRLLLLTALIVACFAAPASAATAPSAPLTADRFALVMDGYKIAGFSELSGIDSQVAASEYLQTRSNYERINKLPGKIKLPTITLKRGLDGSMSLWTWHQAARMGTVRNARRSVALLMYDRSGKPVAKFWLENAWLSKIDIAGLKAGSSEILIETVTLSCESIQRVTI